MGYLHAFGLEKFSFWGWHPDKPLPFEQEGKASSWARIFLHYWMTGLSF